jgi:hypothetical protein
MSISFSFERAWLGLVEGTSFPRGLANMQTNKIQAVERVKYLMYIY